MFPGLGGMNPAQMKAMMKQFGIKSEELNVKKVIFELDDKNLVIDKASVTFMEVQGQKMYQVVGEALEESKSLPEEDVALVAEQASVSKEQARNALVESQGDIAEAISKLKK